MKLVVGKWSTSAALMLFASASESIAFQLPLSARSSVPRLDDRGKMLPTSLEVPRSSTFSRSLLFQSADGDNNIGNDNEADALTDAPKPHRRPSRRQRIANAIGARILRLEKSSSRLASIIAGVAIPLLTLATMTPLPAQAAAPIAPIPKAEQMDPIEQAVNEHERRMSVKRQQELNDFAKEARRIGAEQGEEARVKFEKEYQLNKKLEAEKLQEKIAATKRRLLLEEGICPFTDLNGMQQIFLLEKGIDLSKVQGTQFAVDKMYETRDPTKTFANEKRFHRRIVKAMAQDLENRGEDPVAYFDRHVEQTVNMFNMPIRKAAELAMQYEKNIEEYGQLKPPAEGEISAKERLAAEAAKSGNSKEAAKRMKAEAKAKKAAERAAAKEAKAKAKAEARAAKEEAKAAKIRAKQEKAAAAATAAAALDGSVDDIEEAEDDAFATEGEEELAAEVEAAEEKPAVPEKKSESKLPIVPVSAFILAAGGGAFMIKKVSDRSAAAEEERQRNMKMLLGENNKKKPVPELEVVEPDLSDLIDEEDDILDTPPKAKSKAKAKSKPEPVADTENVVEPPKKKRRGLKNVFGRRKNERETDINKLVSGDTATAPEFASTLAKILTFGAPGRFPSIESLPGGMPMTTYDFDEATKLLTVAQTKDGLSKEQSAEIFANVVNCMLIDIVDLASSTLKEDSEITVDAISIVVDYMNHASSLYNTIAEGVAIEPVTYGGTLAKGKLEQMYGTYAASGMTDITSMDGDFENRVGLLQDVFSINAKKAEGIMMKNMQKTMMEMAKSGNGMEGMEEMMKSMGGIGAGGMPGMEGLADGQEPNIEQLKEMLSMLKELKDSGKLPDAEMEKVREQFRDAFGATIDEIVKGAGTSEDLDENEKELLRLLEEILD